MEPREYNILVLITNISKQEKYNNYKLSNINRNQKTSCGNFNGKENEPKNSYVEGLENIESWIIKKTKENIT